MIFTTGGVDVSVVVAEDLTMTYRVPVRAGGLAAALASGVLSFAWQEWPYKLGLLAAVLVGVAVGMVLTMIDAKPRLKKERAR